MAAPRVLVDHGAMDPTTDARTADHAGDHAPPPRPSAPRLRRSTTDRQIGGVAAGIGTYLGLDPVLVRILFVLTAIVGGAGLVAYLIAWAIMPEDDGTAPTAIDASSWGPDATRLAGIGALVLAALIALDGRWWGDGLILPIALIVGGCWLLVRPPASGGPDAPGDAGPAATSPTAAAGAPAADAGDPTPWAAAAAPPPPPAAAPAPAAPPAPRSATTRTTLGLLALVAGGLGVAASAGADISLRTALLALLALTAGGLVIGAFTGGAQGLIGPGVLLLTALAVVSALDVPLRGGIGERRHAPATLAQVDDAYRLGLGQLTVDLRFLDAEQLDGARVPIEVSVVLGEVVVLVPDDVALEVDASLAAGEITVLDRDAGGVAVDLAERRGEPEAGTLVLDVRAGMGTVTVR